MNNFTGLRPKTPGRMILDAGVFYVGVNEDELRATGISAALTTPWTWNGQTVTPRALGATRGGANFNPQKEERQIEVNGVRIPLRGMDRVDSYTPELSVTLLELADVETLKIGIGQVSITRSASDFDEIIPALAIDPILDYIPNVALVTQTSEGGQIKPMVIVLRNAKVVQNAEIPFEDPGEAAMEVVFRGAADVCDAFRVPFSMYLPVPEDGLGSGC